MYLSLLSGLGSLWGAYSIIHRKPKCPVYPPCRHPRTRLWSALHFIWYWTFITPQSQLAPALTTRPGCSRLGSGSQTPEKSFRSPGLEIIGDQSSKNAKRKQRTFAMISMGQLHETEWAKAGKKSSSDAFLLTLFLGCVEAGSKLALVIRGSLITYN